MARYKNESKNKQNGVVYTPYQMANYVAEEMIKYGRLNDESIKILDPAVGEGSLLIALINKLRSTGKKIIAKGYETDIDVATKTQKILQEQFPDVEVDIQCCNFLDCIEKDNNEKFDFVIANPPYIRTQILGSEKAQKIAERLKLTGRVDIYYAFLVCTKQVLKENGIAGYITSNKFLTIRAGNSVRNYMIKNYNIHQITDLGDTKLFSAAVLPCILIFSLGTTSKSEAVKFTSVYEMDKSDVCHRNRINSIFDRIYSMGDYSLADGRCYKFKQGNLNTTALDEVWTLVSSQDKKWLETIRKNTAMKFSDIGKVRVGIKTTADNVFIGDDWTGEKSGIELLRPLITHRNAGQIVGKSEPHWSVLYTHTMKNGKRIAYDLDDYPNAKKYLVKHYEQLSGRKYVLNAHRNWYEIWVPQNPAFWEHRKIVFKDISKEPEFWLDETGAIVNGDCYWIDINDEVPEKVVYLALAVANSDFIEKYYDVKFNTKLYSGKRRYQTQYVEEFPIPFDNTEAAHEAIFIVKKIIAEGGNTASSYKEKLNQCVNEMFSCQKN